MGKVGEVLAAIGRVIKNLFGRSFILGFAIGFWPTIYFLFYFLAQVFAFQGTLNAIPFFANPIVPVLLIFYLGALLIVIGIAYVVLLEKRFPKGMAYGVGISFAFLVLMAVYFGLTGSLYL